MTDPAPPPSWRLRSALPTDLAAVLAADPLAAAGDPSRAELLHRLLAAHAGPPTPERPVVLVVAAQRPDGTGPDGTGPGGTGGTGGPELAGHVVLRPGHFFGHDLIELLAVHPVRQRQGIGRALLAAAIAAADTPRVFTSTNASNLAMRGLLTGDGWTPGGALDGLNPDLAPGRADLELVWFRDVPHPTGPPARLLHHLALARDWENALADGWYRVSTLGGTLEQTGFVHAAFPGQLTGVAERFYAGVTVPLVLLTLDRRRLAAPVLVEPAVHPAPAGAGRTSGGGLPGGSGPVGDGGPIPGPWTLFPHVYGPVNVDAVVGVQPVRRDPSGRWNLP